ncbi:MAG: oxygen-independent coproporphyrinogen III oxidase [Burkholderiales bacterium]|nr:oxygen-independent coproporphyrinogen III oxidase [Burkholderiales bacterium]
MHNGEALPPLEVDIDLIRRLDRNGPRYTSYPTADRFVPAFTAEEYREWAMKRDSSNPLSIYVHLPFCNTVCFYCACNKVITKDKSKAEEYLRYLFREIEMQGEIFGKGSPVEQLHWGGGTPTFLSDGQMESLMKKIGEHFRLVENGDYSIEIDPRKVNDATIALLAGIGFNRLSLGVQDFDPDVQLAVNRIQTEEETLRVLNAARREGFRSISIDLIYGLPKQTVPGFLKTLEKVIEAGPDRISIYNYAHLPKVFKPQRRIDEKDLPAPGAKLEILSQTIRMLTAAGFVYIGMDHFARPTDELAVAQRKGMLHRNFQGYSTHADCDLVALGVSAIGKIGPTYSQNFRSLEEYYERIEKDELPVMRGLLLDQDDLLRREIIQALMCHFFLSKQELEARFSICFDEYFAAELALLRDYEKEGLLSLQPDSLAVSPKGRLLIRNICMAFDKYLARDESQVKYSKVI